MPLKLPDETKPRRDTTRPVRSRSSESLQTGDTFEYSLTVEVSPRRGQKAWLKVGTTSSVREAESTEQAVQRITRFVEDEMDKRFDELSE